MTTLEISRVQVKDVLTKGGQLTKCFSIKGDVQRDFYLSNLRLQNLIKAYLDKRKKDGDHPDLYAGHDPDEPFFKRNNGLISKLSAGKPTEVM